MGRSKIIVTIVLLTLAVFFIVTTCYRSGEKSKAKALPPGTHGVSVTEVIQTSNYTYLQVEENNTKIWLAVVRREAKPGDSIYYTQAMEMKDFESKELKRTFPSIYFVQDPTDKLIIPEKQAQQPMTPKKPEIIRKDDISIKTPKGAITIADLYKNRDMYGGKAVMVRGVVVKYNSQVMKKNWVHIQDGTEFSGKFDLTVTTLDSLFVVGNTVTFKGTVALNKDFGYGYTYEIMMEDAKASDISR